MPRLGFATALALAYKFIFVFSLNYPRYMEDVTSINSVTSRMGPGNPYAIVLFYSPDCGPCHGALDVINRYLANPSEGSVSFYKCNVSQCREVAMQYNITNIPTILGFTFSKGGQPVLRKVGALNPQILNGQLTTLKSIA